MLRALPTLIGGERRPRAKFQKDIWHARIPAMYIRAALIRVPVRGNDPNTSLTPPFVVRLLNFWRTGRATPEDLSPGGGGSRGQFHAARLPRNAICNNERSFDSRACPR